MYIKSKQNYKQLENYIVYMFLSISVSSTSLTMLNAKKDLNISEIPSLNIMELTTFIK